MDEYQKINSVYKRDERGNFIDGEWACPEFGYLADNPWTWTEKIDGTNVRVRFEAEALRYHRPEFGGRTDNAQMPVHLAERLRSLFDNVEMCSITAVEAMRQDGGLPSFTLYGEGYGAKIQKAGGNYKPDGCDFILFDVRVGQWWLSPDAVTDVAAKLDIGRVPIIGTFSLSQAVEAVRHEWYSSYWDNATMEGMVGTPTVPLSDRRGHRIIVKVKGKDFRTGTGTSANPVPDTVSRGERRPQRRTLDVP